MSTVQWYHHFCCCCCEQSDDEEMSTVTLPVGDPRTTPSNDDPTQPKVLASPKMKLVFFVLWAFSALCVFGVGLHFMGLCCSYCAFQCTQNFFLINGRPGAFRSVTNFEHHEKNARGDNGLLDTPSFFWYWIAKYNIHVKWCCKRDCTKNQVSWVRIQSESKAVARKIPFQCFTRTGIRTRVLSACPSIALQIELFSAYLPNHNNFDSFLLVFFHHIIHYHFGDTRIRNCLFGVLNHKKRCWNVRVTQFKSDRWTSRWSWVRTPAWTNIQLTQPSQTFVHADVRTSDQRFVKQSLYQQLLSYEHFSLISIFIFTWKIKGMHGREASFTDSNWNRNLAIIGKWKAQTRYFKNWHFVFERRHYPGTTTSTIDAPLRIQLQPGPTCCKLLP